MTSLLVIAGERQGKEFMRQKNDTTDDSDDLDSYQIFREMKKQIKALREDMGKSNSLSPLASDSPLPLEIQLGRDPKIATSASSIDADWNPIFKITSKMGSFQVQHEIEVKGSTKATSKDLSSSEPTTNGTVDEASISNAHPTNAVSISNTSGDKDWNSNFKTIVQVGIYPFTHDLEIDYNSQHIESKPGGTNTHDAIDIPLPEPLPPIIDSPWITTHRTLHGMGKMEPSPSSNTTLTETYHQPHHPREKKTDAHNPISSTSPSQSSSQSTQLHNQAHVDVQDSLVNNTTLPIPNPRFACPIPYR